MNNIYNEFQETKKIISELKETVKKVEALTGNIRNKPVIQGYTGKALTLNENINAVKTLSRITSLEGVADDIEDADGTLSDLTTKFNQLLSNLQSL